MTYQIDQSGKIEQTNRDTVLCLANSHWHTILIKARTKRQLQEIFRRHGQIRNFILLTFAAGLAILIKRNDQVKQIHIDREYPGKEATIKKLLQEMMGDHNGPDVHFTLIGKNANAHHYAHDTATKEIKPQKEASLKDLIRSIKKTEVGKRLKNA